MVNGFPTPVFPRVSHLVSPAIGDSPGEPWPGGVLAGGLLWDLRVPYEVLKKRVTRKESAY